MMTQCPQCQNQFDAAEENLGERIGMKLGGALFGSVIGGVTKRTWGVLLGIIVGGMGVFHYQQVACLSQEAARYLAAIGVQTVGIDYLSVGGYMKDAVETHLALLEAGIWIIEGLDLSQVGPGTYDLVCLPIKITRSDGGPARAILRKVGGEA